MIKREQFLNRATLVLLFILTGCSSNKMMSNETAANEIKHSFVLDQSAIHAHIGRVGTNCALPLPDGTETTIDLTPATTPQTIALEAVGYISVASDGPKFWRVALTEKGKKAAADTGDSNNAKNGCDYRTVEFVVGAPELVRITGITADEKAPEVEYVWKWNVTELGRELRKDGKAFIALDPHQRALLSELQSIAQPYTLPIPVPPEDYTARDTMKFKRYTDGWRKQ
jgi:hypothetical protein